MATVDSLSHKSFFMTLQGENGKPIQLENTICLQIKAVTSCSTHKIDQQETDG